MNKNPTIRNLINGRAGRARDKQTPFVKYGDAFPVVYIAKFDDKIHGLRSSQRKAQATSNRDIAGAWPARACWARGWKQTEAAEEFHATRFRVSDLLRGKVSLFRLDMLVSMVTAAGLRTDMRVMDAAQARPPDTKSWIIAA